MASSPVSPAALVELTLEDTKVEGPNKNEGFNIQEDWEVVMKERANDIYPVTKYRSKSTGLTLVHSEIPGPIVHGYLVLATRADSDDGLPHTLEHLVFLGSESFPYKGILDVIGNKCLGSQNAWTDVDHTCFTLQTAGHEGFCQMLPIYLDHLFYPILEEEGFITEVYHVNGDGCDGGVVYSEIQAKENTGEDKSYVELVRTLYPESSGYHYQTGGIMKNIREDCTISKIKDFHKQYYNSKNACIIVCGEVPQDQLFKSFDSIIQKIIKKGDVHQSWPDPWADEIPSLKDHIEKTIHFPAESDDEMLVAIGFGGPSARNEVPKIQAIRLLLEYLTDSTVGALQLAFVENEDSLASSINYAEIENSKTAFYIEMDSVPIERKEEVLSVLKTSLEKQVADEFDLGRMRDIVKKNWLEELSSMENTPNNNVAYSIIGDFLYGCNDPKKFKTRLSAAETIRGFMNKDAEFWKGLIKESILDEKWITIFAISSEEEQKKLIQEENARMEERTKRLGAQGLKELHEKLENAVLKNCKEIPPNIIEGFANPSTNSISFHKIKRFEDPDFAKDLKCKLYFDDITSNFIYVSVLMDTSSVKEEHRKYLALFCESLTENPIELDDGTIMSYEGVVGGLNRDLISHSTGFGIDSAGRFKCGSFSHILSFNLQIELDKIKESFDWIRKILWKVKWSGERIKVLAQKMMNDVNRLKRKGNRIALTLMKDILYKKESNVSQISCYRQQKFLKEIASEKEEKIIGIFEEIRGIITDPSNMTIHLTASLEKVKAKEIDLFESLKKSLNFPEESSSIKRIANKYDYEGALKDLSALTNTPKEYILGAGGIDSSFLVQVSKGVKDYDHDELPALLVAMQYFIQCEGPFYRAIRGGGYAYDFLMNAHIYESMIFFHLYRCTDAVGAYRAAYDVIKDHLNDPSIWCENSIQTAKSSLIYEIIETEKTPLSLSLSSLFAYYHKVPGDHQRKQIAKISEMSLIEVRAATEKYLGDLFLKKSNTTLICPTDKVQAYVKGFKGMEKNLEVLTSLAACPLSSF